jgi:hypothetical protein
MDIMTTLMAAGLALLIAATASSIGMESQVAAQQQNDEIYRIQETAISTADLHWAGHIYSKQAY